MTESGAGRPDANDAGSMADFNAKIIEEFRANGGTVATFGGGKILLLHHIGAKSGTERVLPLAYLPDGDAMVIVASKAGAPTNPDWYHNLKAHPRVEVEVGTETVPVTAEELSGAERDDRFAAVVAAYPGFADYQRNTDRVIPVFALHRA